MAVSVALHFAPPLEESVVKLRVYESTTGELGPYNIIEETTAVGSYPDYIDNFTTIQANSATNWFSIQWVNSGGAVSELSNPIQGGTNTVIGRVTEQVKLRAPNLSEAVIASEAEMAVEGYFKTDPYEPVPEDIPESKRYRVIGGLAYLTMARAMMSPQGGGSGTSNSWSAGLVSMKADTSTSTGAVSDIDKFLDQAAQLLGLNRSVVAQMAMLPIAGGNSTLEIEGVFAGADQSRLVGFVEIP